MTSLSLSYEMFRYHWLKQWRGVVRYSIPQWRGCMLINYGGQNVTELACIFNRWKLWNTGKFSNKWWVGNVPNSPVLSRSQGDWNNEVGISAIMVWFELVRSSRFSKYVIVRSNNNTVIDMAAPVSWRINDLDKVMRTNSCQSLLGLWL